MSLIRHCIVDTTTNLVVNIVEYEKEQTGVPPGLNSHLLCVRSITGRIGETYENGGITNSVVERALTYKEHRAAEYPSIPDQLDTLYHSGLDAWKAQIKTVKDKYPKA
jgi:hypothetical protein